MKNNKNLIVIYSYNQKNELQELIQKFKQYAKHFDFVIFDDNSTDGTYEFLKGSSLKYVSLIIKIGALNAYKAATKYAKLNKCKQIMFLNKVNDYKIEDLLYVLRTFEVNKCDFIHGNRWIEKKDFCLIRKNMSFTYKIKTRKYLSDPLNAVNMFSKRAMKIFNQNNFESFYEYYMYLLKNKYGYKSVQTTYKLLTKEKEKTLKLYLFSLKFLFVQIFVIPFKNIKKKVQK